MKKPKRLVYVSSELHRQGEATRDDLTWERRTWNGTKAYSDTKLHDVLLAFAFARILPNVFSNAMEPGWVPTKMGGPSATGDLDQVHRTQASLAVSDEAAACVTAEYLFHLKQRKPAGATRNVVPTGQAACSVCRAVRRKSYRGYILGWSFASSIGGLVTANSVTLDLFSNESCDDSAVGRVCDRNLA